MADDSEILGRIRAICDEYEGYGYRRVGAVLRSASWATGDLVVFHTSKILRRQCAQHATSVIGSGLARAGS